jgi:hypothetical protein
MYVCNSKIWLLFLSFNCVQFLFVLFRPFFFICYYSVISDEALIKEMIQTQECDFKEIKSVCENSATLQLRPIS